MKKIVAFIVAILVLMLASPVFANLSGTWQTGLSYNDNVFTADQWLGKNELGLQFNDTNLKGVLSLQTTNSFDLLSPLDGMVIDEAYIEAKGSLWPNTQPVTGRIGTLAVNYSPYIATTPSTTISNTIARQYGAQVDGIGNDEISAGLFGTEASENARDYTVLGGHVSLKPSQNVQVNTTYVMAEDQLNEQQQKTAAIEAKILPAQNLELTAAYATDFDNNQSAVKVDGKYLVNSNMDVHAGYMSFDENFDPVYRDRSVRLDGRPANVVDQNQGHTGFTVGTKLAALGADWFLDYSNYNVAATDEGEQDIKAGVATPFELLGQNFQASYEYERIAPETGAADNYHVLGIDTKLPNGLSIGTEYEKNPDGTHTTRVKTGFAMKI